MTLAQRISDRGISEIIHFTTNRGLLGSLHSRHLLSRPLLSEDKYLRHVLQLNAAVRPEESAFFDKSQNWLRFVNLTISEVNRRFLDVSRRWHPHDIWWCILSFEPEIIAHDGVWFTTTNNGYDACTRAQGTAGFNALFAQNISRKQSGFDGRPWNVRRLNRPDHLPTCEQAEVLYPEKLSLDYLRTVYVEEGEYHDTVVGWLSDYGYENVKVVVGKQKFVGRQN